MLSRANARPSLWRRIATAPPFTPFIVGALSAPQARRRPENGKKRRVSSGTSTVGGKRNTGAEQRPWQDPACGRTQHQRGAAFSGAFKAHRRKLRERSKLPVGCVQLETVAAMEELKSCLDSNISPKERKGASCGPSSSDQISARLQKLSKVFAIFGAIFGPARAIFLLEHHARKSPAIRLISLPLPWVFAIVTHGSAYWIGPQYYTASVLPAM